MTEAEKRAAMNAAIGRIFRLASRPAQLGDVMEYERCRAVVLDVSEPVTADYRPSYARDRLKGASGQ